MNVAAVKRYCAAKPGATSHLHVDPWNVLVWSVGGKRFAYFKTSEPERWRFSVKAPPDRFVELTGMPGVKPARFMARFRWITIVDVAAMEPAFLRELVDASYAQALASLTKARRAAIVGAGPAGADARGDDRAPRQRRTIRTFAARRNRQP